MKDERDLRNRGYGSETGATGSATARAEDENKIGTTDAERVDEGNIETNDKARAAGLTAGDESAVVKGFTPFRDWANRTIRRMPAGVTLNYSGHEQALTEITVDGQLRLEWEGAATLIPFDERYIKAVLLQLLPTE
jgi:hypothetical protein